MPDAIPAQVRDSNAPLTNLMTDCVAALIETYTVRIGLTTAQSRNVLVVKVERASSERTR